MVSGLEGGCRDDIVRVGERPQSGNGDDEGPADRCARGFGQQGCGAGYQLGEAVVECVVVSHTRAELLESVQSQINSIERLMPEDIADAVTHMVGRPRRVAVNEMLVRAADQRW